MSALTTLQSLLQWSLLQQKVAHTAALQQHMAHPVNELHSAGSKICLDDMSDIWDVNPSRCCICADHDSPMPAGHTLPQCF